MKNTFYLLLLCAVVSFVGCQKDNLEAEPVSTEIERSSKRQSHKVLLCHQGSIKSVSINALPAHLAHGDMQLVDADEDGFYAENPCVPVDEVDCDDDNPDVNPAAVEICGDEIDNNCNGLIDCEEVDVCEESGDCEDCNVFDEYGFSLSDINVSLADVEESYLKTDCLPGYDNIYRFKHFESFEAGGGRFFDLAYGINIETGLGIVVASGRFGDNDGNEQFFNNITNASVDPAIIQKCINNLIAFAQENGYPMESTICP